MFLTWNIKYTTENIFNLQHILVLWKSMFDVLRCHVSTRLTLSIIAQLLMRAWWVLAISAGYSAHRREPWSDFLQLLQSFRLPLFSFSRWQVSILSQSDLCLPCTTEGDRWAPAIEHVGGRNGTLRRTTHGASFKHFQESLTDAVTLCFYPMARQEVWCSAFCGQPELS